MVFYFVRKNKMKEIDKLEHLPKDISDYRNFMDYYRSATEYVDDNTIITKFLGEQRETLKDVLLLHIFVDKDFVGDEKYVLPDRLQAVLPYADMGYLKFYILHHLHKGKDYYIAIIGWFWWTTMRTNEPLWKKSYKIQEWSR